MEGYAERLSGRSKWYVAGVSGTDLRLDMPSDAGRRLPDAPATGGAAGRDAAGVGGPDGGTADTAGTVAATPDATWPGAAGASTEGPDAANVSPARADIPREGVAAARAADPDVPGAGVAGADVAIPARRGAAAGGPTEDVGDDAARRVGRTEGAGEEVRPPAVDAGQAPAAGAGGNAELAVEGLGLADLLAGALAAYRAI